MFKKPIFSRISVALLILSLAACKQQVRDHVGAQPVEGELVIQAELQEIPGSFPANELYNYAYVMKYKVTKVIKGTFSDPDILVGHYNPRIARAAIKDDQDSKIGGDVKSFQIGDVHYLILSPMEGIWNGAVEDDFFKEKRARYWAFWADKLK